MPRSMLCGMVLLLFLLGCNSGIDSRFRLVPPAPDLVQKTLYEQLDADLSVLNLPIRLEMPLLSKIANEQVPEILQEIKETELRGDFPRVTAVSIVIKRESPILFASADNQLQMVFDISVKGNVKVGLGITSPLIPVEIGSRILLNSDILIDKNWNLIFEMSSDVSITRPLSFNVLGYQLGFEEQTARLLRQQLALVMPKIEAELSKKIALREKMQHFWRHIQEPVLVTTGTSVPAWALIRPLSLFHTPLKTLNEQTMGVDVKVEAKIATIWATRPSIETLQPLPTARQENVLTDEGFDLNLAMVVLVDSLRPIFRERLIGKTFLVSDQKTVSITDIDLLGGATDIVIKASIEGTLVTGDLYLLGRPALDTATQVFYLSDLDYSLETGNLLKKSAAWLLNGLFLKRLEEQMRYDADELLEQMRVLSEEKLKGLSFEQGVFDGKVHKLQATSLNYQNGIVRIDVRVSGSLGLLLK